MRALLLLVLLVAAAQVAFPPWRVIAEVRTLSWESLGDLATELAFGMADSPSAYQFRVDTAYRTTEWEIRTVPLWARPDLSDEAFSLEQLFGIPADEYSTIPIDSMLALVAKQDRARQSAYTAFRVPSALQVRGTVTDSTGLRPKNRRTEFVASFSIDAGRLGLQLLLTALLGGALAVAIHSRHRRTP